MYFWPFLGVITPFHPIYTWFLGPFCKFNRSVCWSFLIGGSLGIPPLAEAPYSSNDKFATLDVWCEQDPLKVFVGVSKAIYLDLFFWRYFTDWDPMGFITMKAYHLEEYFSQLFPSILSKQIHANPRFWEYVLFVFLNHLRSKSKVCEFLVAKKTNKQPNHTWMSMLLSYNGL